ncbi:MAG: beta-N-acetylhexosaminidase [Gammaproteobacteria bacterium]
MTLGPLMVDIAGPTLTAKESERLQDPRIGGVILFSRNYEDPEQVRELVAGLHAVRSPQLLVAVDQEGGRVQRFRKGFTKLPPSRWIGHEFDIDPDAGRELARACGWLMASELLDAGIDISFAPVVDLDLGLSEVIGDRSFHRDPDAVAALSCAYMHGMRQAGMTAVAKHFPGHGAVVADSHLELPVDQREIEEMSGDLLPYRRLIDNGLCGVMMAHVKYPAVDRRIASLSPYWLQTELRFRLGFAGAIFSDDLSMSATGAAGDVPERVRQALDAGADMALICNDPGAVDRTLDELDELGNPASLVRLAAMRPQPAQRDRPALRETSEWRLVVARIEKATARPPLILDG